jgi:hypothetical protein
VSRVDREKIFRRARDVPMENFPARVRLADTLLRAALRISEDAYPRKNVFLFSDFLGAAAARRGTAVMRHAYAPIPV